MYWLFRYHHWTPAMYFDAHSSDRRVIRAFVQQEIEDLKEANEQQRCRGPL